METIRHENLVVGKNCVYELLHTNQTIDLLFVCKENQSPKLQHIINLAKEKGIPIKTVHLRKLQEICPDATHQGVAAVISNRIYASVQDILSLADKKKEPPFILLADEIEDPHNLGAMIRSAECAGAHGIIIPKRHSVGITYAVTKTSAGATEHIPIARVTNIVRTLKELKQRGLWIYGADMSGDYCCNTNLTGPLVLVIGNEGRGLGRLVKENCDILISLPLKGKINSLNASVAAGVLLYEIVRQRWEQKVK